MQVNRGRFLANHNCGYVLKPAFMLEPDFSLPALRNGVPDPAQLTIAVHSSVCPPRNPAFLTDETGRDMLP